MDLFPDEMRKSSFERTVAEYFGWNYLTLTIIGFTLMALETGLRP